MQPQLHSDVSWTDYSAIKTRKGKDALLVSYNLSTGEVVNEWLFPWSWGNWFAGRSCIPPNNVEEALSLCLKGKVKPTRSIRFVRKGSFCNVTCSVAGEWNPSFYRMMSEAREVFGDLEVIRVWA